MSYDSVLLNGTIVDGTGNPRLRSDVGIKGGVIAAMGGLDGETASSRIDATGLVVSPGFIDIHSHSDLAILACPTADSLVMQGVTTIVNGNCGASPAPFRGAPDRESFVASDRFGLGQESACDWMTFGDYLQSVEQARPSINVSSLAGHNRIRQAIMGAAAAPPSPRDLGDMKSLLRESLESGADGMSTGLVFAPGSYAPTWEIAELCRTVADYDGLYTSHIRGLGSEFLNSVSEAIRIAEEARCRLQISHAAPNYPAWGQSEPFLEMVNGARSRGVEVQFDECPDPVGCSLLTRILPPAVQAMPDDGKLQLLRSTDGRASLRQSILCVDGPDWGSTVMNARAGAWAHIVVRTGERTNCTWETLESIARSADMDCLDAALDLLSEDLNTEILNVAWSEDDLQALVASPLATLCGDSAVTASADSSFHPADFGTFPAFIRKYVRGESRPSLDDRGAAILSLEEAVKRMTSTAAQMIKVWDRGLVRPGMAADLVVFDPLTITDNGTYTQPCETPSGIHLVFVNGVPVVKQGLHTGQRPGRVLRRGKSQ